ncbi:MAG: glycerophosphodiester phosphodiesterase family protein [Actinomycetes bacterium]
MRATSVAITVGTLVSAALLAPAVPANAAPQGSTQRTICTVPAATKVSDITYSELTSRYVLNNGEAIPTLKQYLDYANSVGVGVLPEIKNWKVPAYAHYDYAPVGTIGNINDKTLTELEPKLQDYKSKMLAATNIGTKIIGSFDPSVLQWFKDQSGAAGTWDRVWFRSAGPVGGTNFVQPTAPPNSAEMASLAPITSGPYAPLYVGTTGGAPAATALGVINLGWYPGPTLGPFPFNVPLDMRTNNIPVYVWYNVATGGDTIDNGAPYPTGLPSPPFPSTIPSPGWETSASYGPKWIATDYPDEYKMWSQATSQTVPIMVAHRGGGTPNIDENSMQAFQQAVVDGARVLETDVQWTKPEPGQTIGTAVLMHDETINRTMKCKPDCTLAVSAKRSGAVVPWRGTVTLVRGITVSPGCEWTRKIQVWALRGDVRYYRAVTNPTTGAIRIKTYGNARLKIKISITATGNPDPHNKATWSRTWTTKK